MDEWMDGWMDEMDKARREVMDVRQTEIAIKICKRHSRARVEITPVRLCTGDFNQFSEAPSSPPSSFQHH